ncbi:MAG: radical SAM protein [Sulfitobacter sp.]|uniref:B12-binding domain-containing radical SAM protein n=1 Tax=Roseibium sp. TaxID=1936156 RepID=UPI003263C772
MSVNVVIFSDVNGVIGFGRYGGAYRVATVLRNAGYSVQVVEFLASWSLEDLRDIAAKYIDRSTLFVGFATSLLIKRETKTAIERLERTKSNRNGGHLPQDDDFVAEMFSIFRRRNSNVKIVIGGGKSAVTGMGGVDFWMWGPADVSAVALCRHLEKDVPLITRKARSGVAVAHADYPFHGFSESHIDYQLQDLIFDGEHLPIEIDRGCIFRCTFCANQLFRKKGQMIKGRKTLHDEMQRNFNLFGTTGYMFCDDTTNDSREKVTELHRNITSLPFQISWTGFGRVDVIHTHREQRELLLDTGIKAILFGIETLNHEAGKGVGKGLNPMKVKDTLRYLGETWKGKVAMTGSFIVGLPGEDEDSVYRTAEWVQSDDCPLDTAIFSPLNIRAADSDDPNAPISRIAKDPKSYGYEVSDRRPGRGVSTDGPYWRNDLMDKIRATKIVDDIQSSMQQGVPRIADWAVYSRLRNLGYDHHSVMEKKATDVEFVNAAMARHADMFSAYREKLLA